MAAAVEAGAGGLPMSVRNLKLVVTLLKTEGPGALLHRVAFRFFHVHTFLVLRMRLTATSPVSPVPEGIEIKEVNLDELRALREGRADLPEYFYRDESGTEGRCWAGLKNGKLGFIAWVTFGPSSGLVRIGATEMEAAYAYSLEEFRGNRLTTITFQRIARTLFEEGYTAMLATPHAENVASVRALTACGFARIGSIKRLGFFTWPRAPVDYSHLD